MCSGEVIDIRNFFFFDQLGDFYQLDPKPFFEGKRWDTAYFEKKIGKILEEGQYEIMSVWNLKNQIY